MCRLSLRANPLRSVFFFNEMRACTTEAERRLVNFNIDISTLRGQNITTQLRRLVDNRKSTLGLFDPAFIFAAGRFLLGNGKLGTAVEGFCNGRRY